MNSRIFSLLFAVVYGCQQASTTEHQRITVDTSQIAGAKEPFNPFEPTTPTTSDSAPTSAVATESFTLTGSLDGYAAKDSNPPSLGLADTSDVLIASIVVQEAGQLHVKPVAKARVEADGSFQIAVPLHQYIVVKLEDPSKNFSAVFPKVDAVNAGAAYSIVMNSVAHLAAEIFFAMLDSDEGQRLFEAKAVDFALLTNLGKLLDEAGAVGPLEPEAIKQLGKMFAQTSLQATHSAVPGETFELKKVFQKLAVTKEEKAAAPKTAAALTSAPINVTTASAVKVAAPILNSTLPTAAAAKVQPDLAYATSVAAAVVSTTPAAALVVTSMPTAPAASPQIIAPAPTILELHQSAQDASATATIAAIASEPIQANVASSVASSSIGEQAEPIPAASSTVVATKSAPAPVNSQSVPTTSTDAQPAIASVPAVEQAELIPAPATIFATAEQLSTSTSGQSASSSVAAEGPATSASAAAFGAPASSEQSSLLASEVIVNQNELLIPTKDDDATVVAVVDTVEEQKAASCDQGVKVDDDGIVPMNLAPNTSFRLSLCAQSAGEGKIVESVTITTMAATPVLLAASNDDEKATLALVDSNPAHTEYAVAVVGTDLKLKWLDVETKTLSAEPIWQELTPAEGSAVASSSAGASILTVPTVAAEGDAPAASIEIYAKNQVGMVSAPTVAVLESANLEPKSPDQSAVAVLSKDPKTRIQELKRDLAAKALAIKAQRKAAKKLHSIGAADKSGLELASIKKNIDDLSAERGRIREQIKKLRVDLPENEKKSAKVTAVAKTKKSDAKAKKVKEKSAATEEKAEAKKEEQNAAKDAAEEKAEIKKEEQKTAKAAAKEKSEAKKEEQKAAKAAAEEKAEAKEEKAEAKKEEQKAAKAAAEEKAEAKKEEQKAAKAAAEEKSEAKEEKAEAKKEEEQKAAKAAAEEKAEAKKEDEQKAAKAAADEKAEAKKEEEQKVAKAAADAKADAQKEEEQKAAKAAAEAKQTDEKVEKAEVKAGKK